MFHMQEKRPVGRSYFLSMHRVIVSIFSQMTQIFRLDSKYAQSDGKSVNRELPVLDWARSRDSWCILVPIALFSSLSRWGLGSRAPFDSCAKNPPAKRWAKGYGDENVLGANDQKERGLWDENEVIDIQATGALGAIGCC